MAKIDYGKIFIRDACPTKIGGQAVMEGVMMRGPERTALAMRLPSGELYLKTKKNKAESGAGRIPFVRGIVKFAESLVNGMSTLMESADILEEYAPEEYAEEPGKAEKWINNRFGEKAAWNFLMMSALVFAIVISVVFFIILPTWVVNFLGKWITGSVVLNLIEGILRIAMFIAYVAAIRKMEDIKTLFRYHGAEHKTIHCYENGLELTPDNAAGFYTLHPRCGTSFMVFVLIVSLLLFSFLGWPNLFWRILSRILLIPVIAGISYELLRWAGRSDNAVVRVLSWPGLMLQRLTTAEPTKEQLEVGILSLKAVLVEPGTPEIEGFVDKDGNLLPAEPDMGPDHQASAQDTAAPGIPSEGAAEDSEPDLSISGSEADTEDQSHKADREKSSVISRVTGILKKQENTEEFVTINDSDAETDEAWQAVLDAAADAGDQNRSPEDYSRYADIKASEEDRSSGRWNIEDGKDDGSRSPNVDDFLKDFISDGNGSEEELEDQAWSAAGFAPAVDAENAGMSGADELPESEAAAEDESDMVKTAAEPDTGDAAAGETNADEAEDQKNASDEAATEVEAEPAKSDEPVRQEDPATQSEADHDEPAESSGQESEAAGHAPGQMREVTIDPGADHMENDEAGQGSSAIGLENISSMAAEKFRQLTELGKSLIARLRYEIRPSDEAEEQSLNQDDLWAEDSEIMKNKLSESASEEKADEESIREAIRFLSELDKDGYTIVTPDETDVTNIARGIAEHFARDAKARTLARRYTNDISTIENALKWGQAALSMIENGRNEAVMIMSYATGLTRTEIVTRGKELMKDDDFAEYEKRVEMRLKGTPLQYILGMTEFMGLPFRVNPSVLIPRPETEVLTEEVIRLLKEKDELHPEVLDMCTGSGAIGISIAANVPGVLVTLTDKSEEALKTAMNNAGLNKVSKQCIFLLGDMFDALPEDKLFDCIVCNPPYIESDVIETLAPEVRIHEPRMALDGGEDGLDYYRIIAENASSHLRTGGSLMLEIGADQAGSVKRLLMKTRAWTDIHKLRDLAGRDRVVIARRV